MGEKGLVSVITPVFNGMPLIKTAFQSLLAQTYEKWEWVVVNDGSNDGTKEFLDQITDRRVIVHHFEKNQGRPFARQKGLEISTGDFIAMLDADDIYHPKKLEKQVIVLKSNPNIILVASGLCSFGTKLDFVRIRGKGDGLIHQYSIKKSLPVTHAPSMLRRSHAIEFKYNPDLTLGEDVDYLRRYLNNGKYMILPEVLYYYSEFDSVTKDKIRKAYKLYYIKFIIDREYLNASIFFIKYLISFFLFPVIGINFLLKRRGIKPTKQELADFENYVSRI